MAVEYIFNPDLPVIKAGWQGNPVENGMFRNLGEPFDPDFGKVMRWFFSPNPQRKEKKQDQWRPNILQSNPSLQKGDNFICWLGHASFFIRLNGINILTDPIFYNASVVKRLIGNACPPEELQKIDYVLLSHDHRDHCDERSLKTLRKKNDFVLLTALRMHLLVKGWLPGIDIQEAGWYQAYQLKHEGIKITFLPAYHWGRRALRDTKKRLWGSFMIEAVGKTIYFAADSGYKPHFREIGEMYPNIDFSMIGIGAYQPPYVMSEIHTSPDEAINAFRDLGAKKLLPMHYGTYDLSDEPIGEPYRKILAYENTDEFRQRILLPDVGEVVSLG